MSHADLSATQAAALIATRELTAEALVEACLERIEEREDAVQAWQHLDTEYARAQARELDALQESGAPLGPLHGVPVGIKDIFDTRDLPTENGSALDAGRQPGADCAVVTQLREAGAVIMGKTVSTEFAVFSPGKTRNPHDPAHTPGGSSSGSAAAVAAGMVPLAVGTQTNGSMIRPASYCGVVGYKPTHGRISRDGVLLLSRALDHVGVFARSVEDAALMADAIMAYDPEDPDMTIRTRPTLSRVAGEEPPVDPTFAFVKTPVWDQAEADVQDAFAEFMEAYGDICEEVTLPEPFDSAIARHRMIMNADLAKSLGHYYENGRDQISDVLTGMIEDGQKVLAVDYNRAIDWAALLNAGFEKMFDKCDAVITPAATGEAPAGLDATGSPIFCTLWTYLGVPAVSLPLFVGSKGLPIGLQVIGPRGDDARLLRTARWLAARMAADMEE